MFTATSRVIGWGVLAVLIAAFGGPGRTEAAQVAAVAAGGGKLEAAELIQFTVTVEKVDVATREVTVRHEEGQVETIVAGDQVQRLDEVLPGDRVTIGVYRSLTLGLERVEGGQAAAGEAAFEMRAEPGELPGGVATRQITLTARVTEVDPEKSTVGLVGPGGRSAVLEVEADVLAGVAAGDLVTAVYTEALAVSLERVPAER